MKKLTARQYAKMLHATLEKGVSISDATKGLVGLIVQNKQLKLSGKISEEFEKIYNENNNILSVKIESARKLDDPALSEIKQWISQKYGQENIDAKTIVNPALKGGVVVRVGDEKLDLSIVKSIEELKISIRG